MSRTDPFALLPVAERDRLRPAPLPERVEPMRAVLTAFDGAQTSFARLQQRGERPLRVFFYLFDVLHLAGHDTTGLTLRSRKALLRRALGFHDPLRLTPHRNGEGEALFREACGKGWEGLIAKRAAGGAAVGRPGESTSHLLRRGGLELDGGYCRER